VNSCINESLHLDAMFLDFTSEIQKLGPNRCTSGVNTSATLYKVNDGAYSGAFLGNLNAIRPIVYKSNNSTKRPNTGFTNGAGVNFAVDFPLKKGMLIGLEF
jgi:hypothetical protein